LYWRLRTQLVAKDETGRTHMPHSPHTLCKLLYRRCPCVPSEGIEVAETPGPHMRHDDKVPKCILAASPGILP